MTPSSSDTGPQRRRSRLVQIGAIVFVVLLILSMSLGCAKYEGDQAAFCSRIEQVPSFMSLATEVSSGTDAEAQATMADAAEQFRALERTAPRSIRHEVASLGDAAQRIEANLEPGRERTQTPWATTGEGIEPLMETPRITVFYDEMQNHSGTVEAIYSLMNYARTDCGIVDRDLDLGMIGYGPGFGSPFEEFEQIGEPVDEFEQMRDPVGSPFDPETVEPEPAPEVTVSTP